MSRELVASFVKRFPGEAQICCELRQPVDGFSVSVLLGPSGCGKTTVLRCLAGLEQPDTGQIEFAGRRWFDQPRGVRLRPQQRGVGFLFQDYALFPHLTVERNIGYGLRRLDRHERRRRVGEMLELFSLSGLERRLPRQISGGQQQRVALARALACRPRLLLLDEPLSALDTALRERLRGELRRLLSASATPTVIVTHDHSEAIALADQVLVMDSGRLLQSGPPEEVFSRPAELGVARIVGVETVVPATIATRENGLARVRLGDRELLALEPDTPGEHVHVCIRAEDVVLLKGPPGPTSAQNRLAATVEALVPEGPLVRVTLDCGFRLTALVTRPASQELELRPGDRLTALVKVAAVHLLPRS